jgi:NDP-sugar pyrophosphorylase family protein
MRIHAVVMCAGNGTRMKPWTDLIPKDMLPIDGKPVVRHIVEKLPTTCTIVCQTKHKSLYHHEFRDTWVSIVDIEGGKGSLFDFLDAMKHPNWVESDAYLLHYGDELTQIDYRQLFDAHIAGGNQATLALLEDFRLPVGVATVFGQKIVSFEEKPTLNTLFWPGIAVVNASALDYYVDFGSLLFPKLAKEGKLGYKVFHSEWKDIGTIAAYTKVRSQYES